MTILKAIILFGSSVREDIDKFSDVDICIIVKEKREQSVIITEVKQLTNLEKFNNIEYTIHDEKQFNLMLEKGSLFLWHLKLEGKILYENNQFYSNRIKSLKKFTSYNNELDYYTTVLLDLKTSIYKIQDITSFDYSLLFTLIRNSCILICFKANSPKFGRKSAFEYCVKEIYKFPLNHKDYNLLLNHKLKYERNSKIKVKTPNIKNLLNKTEDVINFTKLFCKFDTAP